MIKISHESPAELLVESLKYNDYQYILPYFVKRNSGYREFMETYSKSKDSFTILDNGLFEGEVPSDSELLSMIDYFQPDLFIPPDAWNDCLTTFKKARQWMDLKNKSLPEKTNLMVVLQGKNYEEIKALYSACVLLGYTHFAFNHSSIAYQTFGFSNELHNAMEGRRSIIQRLIQEGIIKKEHYIHLLGASCITEFAMYNPEELEYINSVDTSSPIIYGCKNEKYSPANVNVKPKEKMEHFFEDILDFTQKECIFHNITKFKELFKR